MVLRLSFELTCITFRRVFVVSFNTDNRRSFLSSDWLILDDTHSDSFSVVSLGFLLGGLDSSGVSLLFEFLLEDLLLLHLVDGLDKNGLVLELVTLGSKVEMMIDAGGDLLGLSILSEKSSKNSLSSHPEDLNWHSCVSGTLSLTETGMSSLSLGLMHSLASGSGVDVDLSLHDETIVIEFSNVFS